MVRKYIIPLIRKLHTYAHSSMCIYKNIYSYIIYKKLDFYYTITCHLKRTLRRNDLIMTQQGKVWNSIEQMLTYNQHYFECKWKAQW